jgi:hypothetical protein
VLCPFVVGIEQVSASAYDASAKKQYDTKEKKQFSMGTPQMPDGEPPVRRSPRAVCAAGLGPVLYNDPGKAGLSAD